MVQRTKIRRIIKKTICKSIKKEKKYYLCTRFLNLWGIYTSYRRKLFQGPPSHQNQIMKQKLTTLLLLCLCPIMAMAQKITVSGSVQDATVANEPLPGASVVLLAAKDSAKAAGINADLDGKFELPSVKAGDYILRISYVGFQTYYRNLTLQKSQKKVDMGIIQLKEDSKLMKEAEITEKLAQLEMKADTFIYNSEAFRLQEGAMLEELVKKLPGAELSEDGTLKINGKSVSKIMVEGKEFFENDTKMALKNLPSKMIKKLKAYDRKSDYSRITGIDDGEEETVLDLTVQKGMREGWLINTNLGYGTKDRYAAQVTVSRFLDHAQYALVGNANNANGGWGGGINENQMAGANFAWENGKPEFTAGRFEIGGDVRYSHRGTINTSKTNSEMFLNNSTSTFTNSMSHNESDNSSLNASLRLEWMPDSMTNILFRPRFTHDQSSSRGHSTSVTFNEDPYNYMTNPLEFYDMEENKMVLGKIGVNDNKRENSSEGNGNNVSGNLQYNRRLMKPGRNVTVRFDAGYNNNENTSFSRNEIRYFQQNRKDFTNQYNPSPSTSYNYRGRLSYTEPIIGALIMQLEYSYQYRYSDNDRSMYSIDSLLSKFGGYYTQEQLYLGYLPGLDSLQYIKNIENSQYATYKENNHEANLTFRYNVGGNRLNFGVSLQPQTTHMDYAKHQLDTSVVRHTFNWAPRIDYRWKISDAGQLRIRFNGRMSQPGMTQLLEVVDSSDPLNISTGNSGLRSSWSNQFNIFYNDYIVDKQMGWAVNASFNQNKNSISSATIYNTETGGRYSRPMNINGNWDAGTFLNFNTALGEKKAFNLHSNTNLNYNHRVGYMSSNSDGSDWGNIYNPNGTVNMDRIFSLVPLNKSITKQTNLGENLRLNYRNDILEVSLNGGFNYQHARNAVQQSANLDTWSYNYGGEVVVLAPWGMNLRTDIGQHSRRGFNDASMNTNELIWNAELSQSFLKERKATISLQWYDILKQRSNISRMISATMRSDSWTNAINSYVMVRFIYRLNLLGNKASRAQGGWNGGGGHGGWGGPGGGGFGGGRGRF